MFGVGCFLDALILECILYVNPLLDVQLAKILSHIAGFLFAQFIPCFALHMLFSFTRSHLSTAGLISRETRVLFVLKTGVCVCV